MFLLPMLLIYGISEFLGYKEVLGCFEIVELSLSVRFLIWMIILVLSIQLIFNRIVLLRISDTSLEYKKGIIPRKIINSSLSDVTNLSIESYEDPIAESPTGTDITDYRVVFSLRAGNKKKIKGLSEEDAKRIKSANSKHKQN